MENYVYLPYIIDIIHPETTFSMEDGEIFILYVLSGHLTLHSHPDRILHEMDIFSDSTLRNIHICGSGTAALIRLSRAFASASNDFKSFHIHLDSTTDTNNHYIQLNQRILQLLSDYFTSPLPAKEQLTDNVKKVFEEILSHFPCPTNEQIPVRDSQLRYLLMHCYNRPLSLEDLAAELKISSQYVSIYAKQFLHMPMTAWLTARRLEASEGFLKYTDNSITEIIGKCGFANFNAFNRAFRQKHGTTAAVYRQKYRQCNIPLLTCDHPDYPAAKHAYEQCLPSLPDIRPEISRSHRTIKGDIRRFLLSEMPSIDIIQFGIQDMFSARQMEYVKYVRKFVPVRYVRFGGLLEQIDVSSEGYGFQSVEKILLNLINLDIYPVITFLVNPKTDILNRFRALFTWLVQTFGIRRIRNWQFEYLIDGEYRLQTSPGTQELKAVASVIKVITDIVKEISPETRIGNGMFNTNFPTNFVEALLPYLKKENAVPDFFSLQLYASTLSEQLPDLRAAHDYTISANRFVIYQKIRTYWGIIHSVFPDPDLTLRAQICFSLLKNNILNESMFAGTFLLSNMLKAQKYVTHFTLPILDDSCHFTYKYNTRPYQGIFSLLTASGIPKPLLFAVSLLHQCQSRIIDITDDSLITADIEHCISILLIHYVHPDRFYCLHPQNLAPKDIYTVFPHPQPKVFDLTLTSPDSDSYLAEEWTLSPRHGSIFDLWLNSNNSGPLSMDVIEHLKENVHPEYRYYRLKTEKEIVLHKEILPHEIRLIRLKPQ